MAPRPSSRTILYRPMRSIVNWRQLPASDRIRLFVAHALVRAALARGDVVGERMNRLLIGGVPLHRHLCGALLGLAGEEDDLAVRGVLVDRKSTRLNSSHLGISYAVFCLK